MSPFNDTIVAIASGLAPGAIGVVRVSGPAAARVLDLMTGVPPAPRLAQKVVFRASSGDLVDDGIAIFFPGPNSFTGEDVLELQGHGGPAVLQGVLRAVLAFSSSDQPIRQARPGEFSERAFHNGKLDLLQAQGIADLIAASSAQAARAALGSLRGGFSQSVGALQQGLTDLRVRVEACLDFPEEEIEVVSQEQLDHRLDAINQQFSAVFSAAQRGAALAQGLTIALIGAPNVGKSSLLNALAEEELAIVTDMAGTTRDRIASQLVMDGIPVSMVDTAGLRSSQDPIEQLGIAKSWQTLGQADLVLWVLDATGKHTLERDLVESLAQKLFEKRAQTGVSPALLMVFNQMDRVAGEPDSAELARWAALPCTAALAFERQYVSAKTGAGLEALRMNLKQRAGWTQESGETVYSARGRQLESLSQAQSCLAQARAALGQGALELCAEHLRAVQAALSELTGEVHSDDLLGTIFSSFCIGK
ncbi:MAG: tRNA uridine(34) 5-carboxymethylaminomethyl synthesis GTPase MnmE [Pseudomonadota bacterium]|jgi:tRNA modification GTPase